MKTKENKIKKYFLNKKYLWFGALFFIWMSFFDTNSFFIHLNLSQNKKKILKEINLLKNQIQKEKELLEKINSELPYIEQLAREKFHMKKAGEDIFIITKIKK